MTIQQAVELAIQHHRSGRLTEAEAIYRQILAVAPRHVDTLHLLGIIAHQVGRSEDAVELIRQAITLAPGVPEFYSALGEACRATGQLDQAIAAYRQAVALQPHLPEAYSNLGAVLQDKGLLDEATASYRQAIALKPDYPEAHYNLGVASITRGRVDEAIAAYRHAIALKPSFAEAHCNLGNALKSKGQVDEAIAAYRQAIALNLHLPEAHNNLGTALREKGERDEAIAVCRQAIALRPNYAEAYSNLGNALRDKGELDEAIAAHRQAIGLKPSFAEAHNNLGNALHDNGQVDEAIASYRQAIAFKPDYVEAYNNLGTASRDKGQLNEAIAAYRQAIALNPQIAEAHSNLGSALKDMGQLDEAITACRQAIALKPDYPEAHSNLLLTLNYHPSFGAPTVAEEQRRWNRQHAEPLRSLIQPHSNDRSSERRLRIGYVSPDFREHAVGWNVLPLLASHDHEHLETFCYAQLARPDALTERFHASAHHWRNTVGLTDEQFAAQVREDQIDILVDLALHTAHNRLPVFARQPAPVQVTFAGYPGSTGLSTIDYRLGDPYLDPPGIDESLYSEQTVRLPHSFWCYDPLDCAILPVNPLPAQANGFITFGCLNNFCKINDRVLCLWARVLGAVPSSRLLLLAPEGSHRQHTLDVLEQEGIVHERIEFVRHQPRRKYLELYHRIDLGLDTLPYNGHTTSLDSLWMGVPVVTLVGQTIVGRAGLSQLTNLQLPELIAQTPEQYVEIATGLAEDLPHLSELRSTLRTRMEASPLMDIPRFARDIEAAYRTMWRKWCMEKQPALP